MTLAGRTAIVTGASSSTGEATTRLLAREGCKVALAARREDRFNALAAALGERPLAVPTDVTDPAVCSALVSRTSRHFGALDILVNNAGLGLHAPIHEGDPEDWRAIFDANVLGVLYATRAAARRMLEHKARTT